MKLESELLEEPLVLARLVPGNRKKQVFYSRQEVQQEVHHMQPHVDNQVPSTRWCDHQYWRGSPLLKLDFGLPPGFTFESRVPEHILVDDGFVQRNINRVSEEATVQSSSFTFSGQSQNEQRASPITRRPNPECPGAAADVTDVFIKSTQL